MHRSSEAVRTEILGCRGKGSWRVEEQRRNQVDSSSLGGVPGSRHRPVVTSSGLAKRGQVSKFLTSQSPRSGDWTGDTKAPCHRHYGERVFKRKDGDRWPHR